MGRGLALAPSFVYASEAGRFGVWHLIHCFLDEQGKKAFGNFTTIVKAVLFL